MKGIIMGVLMVLVSLTGAFIDLEFNKMSQVDIWLSFLPIGSLFICFGMARVKEKKVDEKDISKKLEKTDSIKDYYLMVYLLILGCYFSAHSLRLSYVMYQSHKLVLLTFFPVVILLLGIFMVAYAVFQLKK